MSAFRITSSLCLFAALGGPILGSAATASATEFCGRGVAAARGGTPLCRDRATTRSTDSAAIPEVSGPVTGGDGPFVAGTSFDLASVGYEQAEYFLTGDAQAYVNGGTLRSDGRWTVRPARKAPFVTRILVYRPIDPRRFSGTAVIEWLNVSSGLDSAPGWITGHVELLREGHAWVGVSAQFLGIEGPPRIPGLPLGGLKTNDPERYGALTHPGDSFSYDIFSQAGQAVRYGDPSPLGDLSLQFLIATGESQSAGRLVTYVNAIDPVDHVFDGFLIHSRGGGSPRLSQDPEPDVPTPSVVRIRTDRGVPVLTFQTESDTIRSIPDRQRDAGRHRLWEVAGTAHADTYTLLIGWTDVGVDPSVYDVTVTSSPIPGIIDCASPINSGPQHPVLKAAIAALDRWIRRGEAPRSAPLLEVSGRSSPAYVLDELGNVEGGIRTPWVDAPVAKLSGLGQTGAMFCNLFGTTIPFDEATLDELYPDHAAYVSAVRTSAERAVRKGFLLRPDADLVIEAAEQSDIGR